VISPPALHHHVMHLTLPLSAFTFALACRCLYFVSDLTSPLTSVCPHSATYCTTDACLSTLLCCCGAMWCCGTPLLDITFGPIPIHTDTPIMTVLRGGKWAPSKVTSFCVCVCQNGFCGGGGGGGGSCCCLLSL
jgi:hypothetical protein